MMVLFCCMVGMAGIRLGVSWVMLEERWPDKYANHVRQPYMDIAEEALGKYGRYSLKTGNLLKIITVK